MSCMRLSSGICASSGLSAKHLVCEGFDSLRVVCEGPDFLLGHLGVGGLPGLLVWCWRCLVLPGRVLGPG
jgi:hypothetical protein